MHIWRYMVYTFENNMHGLVRRKETDESKNFDEMILEAAKSIAAATSALVKAALAAQRKLVAARKWPQAMFHCEEHSSSTGEPPTPSQVMPVETTIHADNNPSRDRKDAGSGLMPQEADSGYEASPSSMNDHCSFDFERSQGTSTEQVSAITLARVDTEPLSTDEKAEGQISPRSHADEPECLLCQRSCSCQCTRRQRRSSSTFSEEADDPAGSESGSRPPSSSPIPIPARRLRVADDFTHTADDGLRMRIVSSSPPRPVAGVSPLPLPPPLLASSPVTSSLRTYPLSWPSFRSYFPVRTVRPQAVLALLQGPEPMANWQPAIVQNHHPSNLPSSSRRQVRTPTTRNRRRLIDSDASSLSTSESEDCSEEVFEELNDGEALVEMQGEFEPSPVPSPLGTLDMRIPGPLPDVVQSSRRIRSISVNLPLESDPIFVDTVQYVGSALRRLSDEFFQSRQRQRRRTISSIVFVANHTANYLLPTNGDSDESDDFSVRNQNHL